MDASSDLFSRITTYSLALRYLKGDESHVASYQKVIPYLDTRKATMHKNTNLSLAAVSYIKHGFTDGNDCLRKVNIAMYIAVLQADDQHSEGLAKEVYDRCRELRDLDRNAVTKVFKFSTCNNRIRLLLDKVMVSNTEKIHAAIEHEFQVEFISLFLRAMENIVGRGEPLAGLEYMENATPCEVGAARTIIERHASSIATKFGSCFNTKAFKKPRAKNNLFPAQGALPRVSIGCELINFDEVTVDFLKDVSLSDTNVKYVFLETMYAAVLHSSNEPRATYGALKLKTVQDFYMDTFLDRAQRDEALGPAPETSKERDLREEVETLQSTCTSMGERYLKVVKEASGLRDVIRDLKEQLKHKSTFCSEFNLGKGFAAKNSGTPAKMDKHWLMRQRFGGDEHNELNDPEWSGDEDE